VKIKLSRAIAAQLVLLLLLTQASFAQPQGKVVINEYMPWTSNTCGTTSEFVELLNFGPGPVNIGCYILTTGIYSVTIPPNTILKPGEFYVIAGRDVLPGTCGNVDSTSVRANLNWNNCNCTNTAIPTASNSEGMMADNGSSPLVLLDPSLNVVDAVIRSLPGAATGTVTSSSVNGACVSRTFNLGTMNITYEELGMAPGNQNSYARTLDGDCVWLKQPNQSGTASNNRRGNITDINYEFIPVNLTDCGDDQGTISIFVKHSNYASIFPMTYTIALDYDRNGFDLNDEYRTDTVYDPPFIEISNLPIGRYRVTVASVKGCYLESFDFNIITCNPGTLPVKLAYFRNAGSSNGKHYLEWLLQEVQNLQSVIVEKGNREGVFVRERVLPNTGDRGTKQFSVPLTATPDYPLYRLRIVQKNGTAFYSNVIRLQEGASPELVRLGPNPATNQLDIQLNGMDGKTFVYSIIGINGTIAGRGTVQVHGNRATVSIPLHHIGPGTYQLQLAGGGAGSQPISLRFVKH
jgi:hypothetical protein